MAAGTLALVSTAGWAADPVAAPKKDPASATPKKDAAGSKTDPATETPAEAGKSYGAALSAGFEAYSKGDYGTAVTEFEQAVRVESGRKPGYYHLGGVHHKKGTLPKAIETWSDGTARKGDDDTQARMLFALAVVHETASSRAVAKDAWAAYLDAARSTAKARPFIQAANEHVKALDRVEKQKSGYAAVKERIEKRQKLNESAAAENAKKDTQNK